MKTIANVQTWFKNTFVWRNPREKARIAYNRVTLHIEEYVDYCIRKQGVKPYNIYVLINLKAQTLSFSVNGAKSGITNYKGLFSDILLKNEAERDTFQRELDGMLVDRYNAIRTTNGVNYRLVG